MTTKKDGKILLIEQDYAAREVTKTLLRAEGYSNILDFESAEHFMLHVAEINEGEPEKDIALIICNMGFRFDEHRTSGLNFLEALRNNNNNIPFVLLTGGTVDQGQAESLKKLGNVAVVGKPFTPEKLASIVDLMILPRPFDGRYDDPGLRTPGF